MSSPAATGMALSIRQAEESETFDLAGNNVETIKHTITAAFSQPLPLKGEMIRITFITGAGKQARQKYDEGAARAVTSTLRDLGYEEDRAASAVVECAGSFKLQHDTGKNLKTVVVFPKIVAASADGADGEGGKSFQSLIPEGCPAHKIAMSTKPTFEGMLQSQCPSWSQKKGCLAALEHLKSMVDEMDAKLMKGTPLEDAEQEFYDQVTALDDKISLAKDEMHKQVESGGITVFEKDTLLQHNAERLEALKSEMEDADGKKLEKLKAMNDKMKERRELLDSIDPKQPHKLRYEQEIAKLWKEAIPLLKLEEQTKGRLLSVKETQTMARKDEIMEEIENLEEASRGWFEDDAAFDARVEIIRANFKAKLNTQKSKGGGGGGGKKSSGGGAVTSITGSTKWVTPGESLKKNAWESKQQAKKKKKGQGSGVFAAMMMQDSDSDDEEEDDQDNNSNDSSNSDENDHDHDASQEKKNKAQEKDSDQNANSNPSTNNAEAAADGSKKKTGKKKNKKSKGGGKKKDSNMTEDEVLNSAAAANAASKKKKEEAQEVSNPAINFLRNYLIPFILAIITWIASLFLGKPKPKRKKD